MSRENDIKALRQLKNDMLEADAFAELAKEEWDKSKEYKSELENSKFVFKPLPTNNEQVTKDSFIKAWKDNFSNTAKYRRVFLLIYSFLMLAFSVALFIDFNWQKGWIFTDTAYIHGDNTFIETILLNAAQIAFCISAIFLPWYSIYKKISDGLQTFLPFTVVGYIVGGLLFLYTAWFSQSMFVLFTILIATVAAFVISLIIHIVCVITSKFPTLSAKQKTVLAAEKQRDIDNAEQNKMNEEKEKAEWEAWWEGHKLEVKEKMLLHLEKGDVAMEKAKAHLASAEASDALGESEKSPEIIDWLLYFIESRRADSIKESLHEFDKMQQNKKMLEIEKIKFDLEVAKAQKENADRRHEMEMNRRHQLEMEMQAKRNADMQSQIAANTAAMRDSAERMRRDAASHAAQSAATQAQVAADIATIRRNDYYNS